MVFIPDIWSIFEVIEAGLRGWGCCWRLGWRRWGCWGQDWRWFGGNFRDVTSNSKSHYQWFINLIMSIACIVFAWWTSNYHQACSVHRKMISRRKKSKISNTAWAALVPVSPCEWHWPRPQTRSHTSWRGSNHSFFRKSTLHTIFHPVKAWF